MIKSEKDNELTVWVTSRDKKGNRSRVTYRDETVTKELEWIEAGFKEVFDLTGHLPNMLGIDESNLEYSIKPYKRVVEELNKSITEVSVMKRLGRSYAEFFYMEDDFHWYFPIREAYIKEMGFNIPYFTEPAGYGFKRTHDTHTGVDLHCLNGTEVYGVEHGVVVNIEQFTGEQVGSPWWHDTQAVWVKGQSGIVVYGEINPAVKVGDKITPDTLIGKVQKVLRKDKGVATSMLHIELYEVGMTETVIWNLEEPKPKFLKDPTPYLIRALSQRKENSLLFIMKD